MSTVPLLINNKKKFGTLCTINYKLSKGGHWLTFLIIGLERLWKACGPVIH